MSKVVKRRRGTAIVDTTDGILVTAGTNRVYLLPGGGTKRHETRMMAAMRELKEETGLETYEVKYLFRHKGNLNKSHGHGYFQNYHTVRLIKAKGEATPRHEIKSIAYYQPGSNIHISRTTKEIINRYYDYKKKSKIRQKLINLIGRIFEWLVI